MYVEYVLNTSSYRTKRSPYVKDSDIAGFSETRNRILIFFVIKTNKQIKCSSCPFTFVHGQGFSAINAKC